MTTDSTSSSACVRASFADGRGVDICIVGGGGHVGLPLGIVFANKGYNVLINDINAKTLENIAQGRMPFMEQGAEPLLRKALDQGRLSFSCDVSSLSEAPVLIVTIGTPVDEFHNPDYKVFKNWIMGVLDHLRDGQLLLLRSTVFPGTTTWLDGYLRKHGRKLDVAFCPERIVEGKAVEELTRLPQIVSGTSETALRKAGELFKVIAPSVVELSPMEAEFAKLFANTYRYVQFAVANQFYMICDEAGIDYHRVQAGVKQDYPRLADMPGSGFAAGPCLFKDTLQLAAFLQNRFALGNAAVSVNEGIMLYITDHMLRDQPLGTMTVGLLGMAFKANSDDIRSSLSYKLKKILEIRAKDVLTTDPYVTVDPNLLPLDEVIDRSDLLILCAPHSDYKGLDLKGTPVLDIWGFFDKAQRFGHKG
ncbi:MAG: nucleotide sugar dehydrogenase [Desulfovibrionaceae bacterium]